MIKQLTDLYWLAGILEGEGSFMAGSPSKPNCPSIQMTTTDEDVAFRVASLLGVTHRRINSERFARNGWKPAYFVSLKGQRAFDVMQQLRPLMGQRRQAQIAKACACFCKMKLGTKQIKLSDQVIAEIRSGALTAKEAAQRYGVHETTIYRVRNGTRRSVRENLS